MSVAPPPRRAGPLDVLWRFSRPHTMVGTAISVVGLYAIAVAELPASGLADLWWVLVAGAGVNVAIVGVNQLADVDIDRVNKPHLPLAAGDLSAQNAWRIVAVAAPVPASLSISGVRAVVVNLGVYGHFSLAFGGELAIAAPVWALTLFVLPFSFAIAVLKDVPDMEGDRRFRIATFTVRLGPRRAARLGIGALLLAYAAMIALGPLVLDGAQPAVLVAGHAAALIALLAWARRADPHDRQAFSTFYMRVWVLFFLEYLLVPVAVVTG